MKISIIIPFHNKKENIRKVCICLSRQRFEGHEVDLILVDHASDDETNSEDLLNILIGTRFNSVRYNRIPKRDKWSASIPRNIGAKLADKDTDAFYFLDSDILLPPDRIQRLLDDYTTLHDMPTGDPNPKRVIIGPYHFLNHSIDVTDPSWYMYTIENYAQDVRWRSFEEHSVLEENQGIPFCLSTFGGSLLVPKDLFFKAGKFPEDIGGGCEDGAFGLQLGQTGATFSLDRDLLGWHNWHEVKSDRHEGIPEFVKMINLRHFGSENPDYGLIDASKEAYESWKIKWTPPKEWQN